MKSLILHADDYGISPAVNEAIIRLGEKKRLSGTGVMTVFPESLHGSDQLRLLDPFDIGLHITLTDQILCSPHKSFTDDTGKAYNIKKLIYLAFTNRLNLNDLETEIRAQLDRFYDIFGRFPDYFDGHQHVQLLQPVRKALYNVTQSLGHSLYIRSAHMPLSFGLSPKECVLRLLNGHIQKDIHQYGWRSNIYFAGAYGKNGFSAHLESILSQGKKSLLMMIHPGHIDDLLRQRDPMQEAREKEYQYLTSDHFTRCLDRYGYEISHVA